LFHAAGASAFVLEQLRPSGATEVRQGSAGSGLRTRAGALPGATSMGVVWRPRCGTAPA